MNKKIIVTIGISGSGKSTWSHEQWLKDPLNTLIVNRDSIRNLLFGYTDETISEYYQRKDISSLEKQITLYEDTLIHDGLNQGKTVIVDATHLENKYLKRFDFFNANVEYKLFNIDLETAIERDSKRIRSVGSDVIKKQYNRLKNLRIPTNLEPITITNDISKPSCIVVDIDGTVADKCDRDIYDGSKCHMDYLIEPIANLVKKYDNVIFCSGRDDRFRKETEEWLNKHNFTYKALYMRKYPDMRPDWIVKEEMWREITEDYYIELFVDDRNSVCRRARFLGFKVVQVEYGNF